MRALLEDPLWRKARADRKYQRLFGVCAGIFLAVALIALFDGLIAQMRQGANELEFLPGETLALSGPSALKNPIDSDVVVSFSPPDAPFKFGLEGFFAGYWFGNGMWRGGIAAADTADPGRYEMRLAFRGAPAQSAQKYTLLVFADAAAMRAGALSFIRRWLDVNPFVLAAWAGGIGVFCGILTYFFGRRLGLELAELGLAEVYASDPETATIWCLAPRSETVKPGLARMALDWDGRVVAEARIVEWKKGKLKLTLMDGREIPAGALVCLRHPDSRPPQ